jgi:hypothetical protein
MKQGEALTVVYNGLINNYQFQRCALNENSTPEGSRYFSEERMRKSLTNEIDSLSQIAYDLGEHEMAADFLRVAIELGGDAIPPMPL